MSSETNWYQEIKDFLVSETLKKVQEEGKDQEVAYKENVAPMLEMASQMFKAGISKEEITKIVGNASKDAGIEVNKRLPESKVLFSTRFLIGLADL